MKVKGKAEREVPTISDPDPVPKKGKPGQIEVPGAVKGSVCVAQLTMGVLGYAVCWLTCLLPRSWKA